MNILEQTEALKDLPDAALIQQMKMPTGEIAPIFITSELKRRKRMRDDYARREAADTPTVAEEVVMAAGMPQGGIADAARALAPKTDMGQNTGMGDMMPRAATQAPQPQMMAEGGIVRLAPGGQVQSKIQLLKERFPEIYETNKDDPEQLAVIAEYMIPTAMEPKQTGLEGVERQPSLFEKTFSMVNPSNRAVDKMQRGIAESQPQRALDARAQALSTLRAKSEDDPVFAEGAPVEYLTRGTVQRNDPGLALEYVDLEGADSYTVPDIRPDFLSREETTVPRGLSAPQMPDVIDSESGDPALDAITGVSNQEAIRDFLARDDVGFGFEALQGSKFDVPSPQSGDPRRAFGLPLATVSQGNLDYIGDTGPLKSQRPAIDDLRDRVKDYYSDDQFTAPKDVYKDLYGGQDIYSGIADPRILAAYEEAPESEMDAFSNRLYLEEQQGQEAKANKKFAAEDAEVQAEFDAANEAQQQALDDLNKADEGSVGQRAGAALDAAKTVARDVVGVVKDAATTRKNRKESVAFDADTVGVGSEPVNFDAILADPASAKARQATKNSELAAQQVRDLIAREQQNTNAQNKAVTAQAGSLEARITDAIAKREKQAEQDKWLALAQSGLILASGNPADISKAGTAGLKYLQTARAGKNKFDTDMMTLQARIDAYKARASGKSGLNANQMLTRGTTLLKQGQEMLEGAGDNADAAARARQIIDYGNALVEIAMGGSGASPSGATTVDIS